MFTLLTHVLYAITAYYMLKVHETYQAQTSLGADKQQAFKNALVWPKYLIK